MNETARAFLISAVSGLIAFGGAVLYLGGEPSEPALTRADVQSMIGDTPPALTPADVKVVIDEAMFDAYDAASSHALCAVGRALLFWSDRSSGVTTARAEDIFSAALDTCRENALDRLYNVGE